MNNNEASLKFVYPERLVSESGLRKLKFMYIDFVEKMKKLIMLHVMRTLLFILKQRIRIHYRDTVKRTEPLGRKTEIK